MVYLYQEDKMGQWKLEEGKSAQIFDNYSKAREAYGKVYRKNESLRNSPDAYTRNKYQTVKFRKIA